VSRVFLTGATGFLGGRIARILRARGHEVTALVRLSSDRAKVARLESLGVEIAPGDVTEPASLLDPLARAECVIHSAAWYELGVRDHARMERINVGGTRNVLQAAIASRTVRTIVHVSSVAALGPTGGRVVDESHLHPGSFGSAYDRTKHAAHELARELRAETGARIRIALPGTIFGPGDRSLVCLLFQAHTRGALRAMVYPELSMSLVHVEDCARGVVAVAERGADNGEYNLVAEVITMAAWAARLSEITGIPAPKIKLPEGLLRFSARFSQLARDAESLGSGASWSFSSARARSELGWTPMEFGEALADTLIDFDRRHGREFAPATDWGRRALDAARGRGQRGAQTSARPTEAT
jgi:nucleoside-diphosphate-sugar epimerase